MTDATDTAAAAASTDPGVGLRAVAALRRLADQLEALQVRNARAAGWSWEDIGVALGVSKQAVHKKYGRTAVRAAQNTGGQNTIGQNVNGQSTNGER